MTQRKTFPLRLPPELYDALHRWAEGDLRSVNAQIEFLLRDALQRAGRLSPGAPPTDAETSESNSDSDTHNGN